MKRYYTAALAFFLVIGSVSCKKFVEEELVSTLTFDHYKTDVGLEDLVESAYVPLRWKFNGEQSYALFNFGDDEFILGDQFNNSHYLQYSNRLDPNEALLNGLWINHYNAINRCNIGIDLIGAFNDPASTLLGTYDKRRQRIGELRFLRAFYYFTLVQQFGGVPLVLNSSNEVRTDFPRASTADVYKAIIADLIYAKDNLSPNTTLLGRATKGAAQHFLAKAYLTRGSATSAEAKAERGTQPTDMDSTILHAKAVIAGPYTLEPDYMNLWNGVYPNGYPNTITPAIGEQGAAPVGDYSKIKLSNSSKEIIFAAQFINNPVANGQNEGGTNIGNRVHEYFIMQYDDKIPGLVRDQFNGRPFRRLGPSDYTIDLFDRKNDSRFYKSFRTAYYSNTAITGNVFTAANVPNGDMSLVGKTKFGVGDTAAYFIVNDRTNPILTSDLAKYRFLAFARWVKTSPTAEATRGYTAAKYLTLVKHLSPVRVNAVVNEESGVRNGIYARLGETYLILAEAQGRKGLYGDALININKVRERAAYKPGEFKNPQTWKFDGGTPSNAVGTYPAFEATMDLFTTNAPSELYPVTVTTTEERFIHFMLNERTRELCGELYRWEDLVRTETLYQRVNQNNGTYVKDGITYKYNPDATGIQPHHKLRPIPQQQIELTTSGGSALTADQKKTYQNPGYSN
ncbi:RagB/SusD family nutrient uptake outer membrane protein [Paradesertivirga mongoliensis]|uniref:RagB/SusD family nutrient uptake outer membrane protein n=1 Tax=Paradesertivirga mongoliensis TaxID=2100740 RepID=A0ABW4ZJR1_9SPHI|nr:RagB/SusD family nutrient uptake outer membrane protein [Pedobacter mongoliensis]